MPKISLMQAIYKYKNSSALLIRFMPLIIFLVSLLFLNILQDIYRPYINDRVHFQAWTSDQMMQALPIKQLKETPVQSLWYLHKQPPMLDFIRAIIVRFFRDIPNDYLLLRVDRALYYIWSFFFAVMSSLVYVWVKRLSNIPFALVSTFIWILHPDPIFYSMLLESTLMSSLFTLWFFYELWRFNQNYGSIYRLALTSVFLFYTRTIFQWYFFPIVSCLLNKGCIV